MKHTKGPWKVSSIRVFGADNVCITTTRVTTEIDYDAACANARLIAASPELLKALTAAEHALRSYQYGNSATDLAEETADACHAAIAKATQP